MAAVAADPRREKRSWLTAVGVESFKVGDAASGRGSCEAGISTAIWQVALGEAQLPGVAAVAR